MSKKYEVLHSVADEGRPRRWEVVFASERRSAAINFARHAIAEPNASCTEYALRDDSGNWEDIEDVDGEW